VQVDGFPPFPVSYQSIVPKSGGCENLPAPVCLSASHIAFDSIRMEPVFMVLGQSTATAAAQAIEEKVDVQNLDYAKLRERPLADGQKQISINQRENPDVDEMFVSLGVFRFEANGSCSLEARNDGADGWVIADAVNVIEK